jgi:hypothetical protein
MQSPKSAAGFTRQVGASLTNKMKREVPHRHALAGKAKVAMFEDEATPEVLLKILREQKEGAGASENIVTPHELFGRTH